MDVSAVIVVIAIAFAAGVAQGLTGFGFGLVVVPVFLLVLNVRDTVVVSTLLAAASVAVLSLRVWREVPWRVVALLLAGSVVGMPLGLAVLLLAPQNALRLGVGLAVIVMAGALARGVRIADQGLATELVVGLASGILRTSTSLSGPPVVLYLQSRGYPPEQFRAALVMFFLVGSVASIGAFFGAGAISGTALVAAAVALPAVFAGIWTGDRLLGRVDATLFRRLVLALLFATALTGVASSIQRLVG